MTEEQAVPDNVTPITKDFGSAPVEEGPSFSLGGQTFRTKKAISPKAIMSITEEGGLENIFGFISLSLLKEDRQRFLDMTNDDDAPITTDMVAAVSNWLVELHSNNRPTSA